MQPAIHRFRITKHDDQSRGRGKPVAVSDEEQRQQQQQRQQSQQQQQPQHKAPGKAACQRCRRLKKRCSKASPQCNHCLNAGVICSLAERSRAELGPLVAQKEKERLEARITWLSNYVNKTLPRDAPSVDRLETGADIGGKTTNTGVWTWTPVSRESELRSDANPHPNPNLNPRPESIEKISPPTSTHHGDAYASDPSKSPASDNATIRNGGPQLVPGNVGITSSRHAAPSPEHRSEPLSPGVVGRRFVDAYFRHIHRAYPFMDRENVLRDVDVIGDWMNEGTEKMPTKLYMVMAIGCTTLRRVGQVSEDICSKFKISYPTVLEECLSRNDVDSVASLLLLGLHSLFDSQGISPYVITGILSRQVMALGLSRSKTSIGSSQELREVEARHRLYWSAYTLDRMVSASVGLPFGICDSNANIPLPGVTLEEYASPDRNYYTLVLQVNRHIISLRQLEESILQKIQFPNSYATSRLTQADRRVIIQELRTQIENWYTQGCLVTPMERDQLPFHNTIPWLNYRYQNLLLLLYTPSHFNSPISMDHLLELQRCAQKYIQLSAVLWQQRHLPMNWVTLCRFVAIAPVLLYCGVRNGDGLHFMKEEAILCATVLEAFPSHWLSAKHAARVFRRLAMTSNSNLANGPLLADLSGGPGTEAGAGRGEVVTLDQIKSETEDLVANLLGEASMYVGAIDAAGDLVKERITGQLLDGFRTELPLDTSWMAGSGVWDGVGDLSMGFI